VQVHYSERVAIHADPESCTNAFQSRRFGSARDAYDAAICNHEESVPDSSILADTATM
jgi:hypothetical protein